MNKANRIMLFILMALIAVMLRAQDITYPFECLPELEGLHHIEARSIWVGYANGGWDVGKDTHRIYKYNSEWVNTFRIYYSAVADEYYVMAYDKRPEQDEGKKYLSWHPCGQGAISEAQYEYIVKWADNE